LKCAAPEETSLRIGFLRPQTVQSRLCSQCDGIDVAFVLRELLRKQIDDVSNFVFVPGGIDRESWSRLRGLCACGQEQKKYQNASHREDRSIKGDRSLFASKSVQKEGQVTFFAKNVSFRYIVTF